MNRIQAVLANPHTTWAGLLAVALQVAQIWVPSSYDQKLDKTTALVLSYAAVMGSDAKKRRDGPADEPEPPQDASKG